MVYEQFLPESCIPSLASWEYRVYTEFQDFSECSVYTVDSKNLIPVRLLPAWWSWANMFITFLLFSHLEKWDRFIIFRVFMIENLTKRGFNGRKVYLSTTGRYNTSLQGGRRLLVHISVDQEAEKGAAGDWQISFFPLTTESASTAHDIIRFRQVFPTWLILSENSRTVLYQCPKCFLI